MQDSGHKAVSKLHSIQSREPTIAGWLPLESWKISCFHYDTFVTGEPWPMLMLCKINCKLNSSYRWWRLCISKFSHAFLLNCECQISSIFQSVLFTCGGFDSNFRGRFQLYHCSVRSRLRFLHKLLLTNAKREQSLCNSRVKYSDLYTSKVLRYLASLNFDMSNVTCTEGPK